MLVARGAAGEMKGGGKEAGGAEGGTACAEQGQGPRRGRIVPRSFILAAPVHTSLLTKCGAAESCS